MKEEEKTKEGGNLIKVCLIIVCVFALCGAFFFGLKKFADKQLIDAFLDRLEHTVFLDSSESEAVVYQQERFNSYIELLIISEKGYFSKQDISNLGLELPGIQIFYLNIGLAYIDLTRNQQETVISISIEQLKSMSQQDFGNNPSLWQDWQNKKEELESKNGENK